MAMIPTPWVKEPVHYKNYSKFSHHQLNEEEKGIYMYMCVCVTEKRDDMLSSIMNIIINIQVPIISAKNYKKILKNCRLYIDI